MIILGDHDLSCLEECSPVLPSYKLIYIEPYLLHHKCSHSAGVSIDFKLLHKSIPKLRSRTGTSYYHCVRLYSLLAQLA